MKFVGLVEKLHSGRQECLGQTRMSAPHPYQNRNSIGGAGIPACPRVGAAEPRRSFVEVFNRAKFIRLLFVVSGICVLGIARAEAAVGDWTSYSRLIVRKIAASESEVWAATEGGIIRSNLEDGSVRAYSPTEGLPDKVILSVLLDERGTAWFGTGEGGLLRFTRRPGLAQPVLEAPLLAGEVLSVAALTLTESRMYVGHRTGVTVLDRTTNRVIETYHQLGASSDIRNEQVTAIAVFGTRILVGLVSGLSWGNLNDDLLLPNSWTYVGAPFDSVRAIVSFRDAVYVAARAGIRREGPSGWSSVGLTWCVRDLAVFDDAIWAATDSGLYVSADGNTWATAAGLTTPVRALAAVPGRMLVVAGSEGTYCIESRTSSDATKVPGVDFPPSNSFSNLAVDTSGAVWVAPGPGRNAVAAGVFRLKNGEWLQYLAGVGGMPAPEAGGSGFVSIAVDRQNRVWAGSWGAGIALFDQRAEPPTVRTLNSSNTPLTGLDTSPHYLVVSAFLNDPSGALWAGIWHSLAFALPLGYEPGDPGVLQAAAQFLAGDQLPRTLDVTALALDPYGVLWIGTSTAGVILIDTGGTPTDGSDDRYVGSVGKEGVDPGAGMLSRNVRSIAIDRDGVAWVGTDAGLTALRGTYSRTNVTYTLSAAHYTVDAGLPADNVQVVIADSFNVKWIGTDRGLGQILGTGQVVNLTSSRLVDPDGNVTALAFDAKRGYLWIGTPSGLNRYEAYPPQGGQGTITVQLSSNPFRIGLSVRGTDYVLTGRPLTLIVSPGATVRIYTITGELVWEADDSGIGQLTWDGRTLSKKRVVASGVYLYVAERAGQRTIGKIAVLRDAR